MSPALPFKVLVIEDEPIVQTLLASKLAAIGGEVIGTARSVEKGLELARLVDADVALLDVLIGIDYSFPIAEILDQRNIPYVYVTGYPMQLPLNGKDDATSLEKPFRSEDLKRAINHSLSRHRNRPTATPTFFQRIHQRLKWKQCAIGKE